MQLYRCSPSVTAWHVKGRPLCLFRYPPSLCHHTNSSRSFSHFAEADHIFTQRAYLHPLRFNFSPFDYKSETDNLRQLSWYEVWQTSGDQSPPNEQDSDTVWHKNCTSRLKLPWRFRFLWCPLTFYMPLSKHTFYFSLSSRTVVPLSHRQKGVTAILTNIKEL